MSDTITIYGIYEGETFTGFYDTKRAKPEIIEQILSGSMGSYIEVTEEQKKNICAGLAKCVSGSYHYVGDARYRLGDDYDRTIFFENVRGERNFLLNQSDWTQFQDSPITGSKLTEWQTYRQELRDLPSTITYTSQSEDTDIRPYLPTKPS